MEDVRWEFGVHVVPRVVIVVHDPDRFGNLVVLVVSSKDYDGGVVPQSGYCLFRFELDGCVDLLVRGVLVSAIYPLGTRRRHVPVHSRT